MHIILGALGLIVTILILINRLTEAGIDIGWLNPFTWRRRRAWRKQYEGNPVFFLNDPLEVAAMLATSVAKIDGEISSEEKQTLLTLFQKEFSKTEKEASELLMSSIYIFGDGEDAISKPEKVMKRTLEKFSEDQAKSVISLLNTVKEIDSNNANLKERFINKVEKEFDKVFNQNSGWS